MNTTPEAPMTESEKIGTSFAQLIAVLESVAALLVADGTTFSVKDGKLIVQAGKWEWEISGADLQRPAVEVLAELQRMRAKYRKPEGYVAGFTDLAVFDTKAEAEAHAVATGTT